MTNDQICLGMTTYANIILWFSTRRQEPTKVPQPLNIVLNSFKKPEEGCSRSMVLLDEKTCVFHILTTYCTISIL